MGPTASGKTALAEALADKISAKLINADAFQVYRHLDIGTAKSSRKSEYNLIDILDPDEEFGVGDYVQRVNRILWDLFESGTSAVLVGGSGLHIRATTEQYQELFPPPDPTLRAELNLLFESGGLAALQERLLAVVPSPPLTLDLQNPIRVTRAIEIASGGQIKVSLTWPNFKTLKIGIDSKKHDLDQRIESRVDKMLADGWVEEVKRLRENGYTYSSPGLRAHGYRRIWRHLDGMLSLDDAASETVLEVRRYAKRQKTWLRTEPKVEMLPDDGSIIENAMRFLSQKIV